MKRTGELLRTARENAKLSLSEVALSTKINPKVLAAIENGDQSHLPAKTFLKGFVRSYAAFLKMDADQVIKTFNEEMSGASAPASAPSDVPDPAAAPEPVRAEPVAPPAPEKKQRRVSDDENFSGLRAVAVTVIVVLIGLIIGVRELIEKYQREKVVETSAEVKISPLPETARKPNPKEMKAEEPPKALAETKPAAPAAVPTPAAVEAPAPEPMPAPAAAAPPTQEVATKPEPPAPAPAPAADPANPQPAVRTAKNEIILEALDKVEVKFKIRGQTKVLSLGPTQVHTIFADEAMVLDFSDGGVVNVIVNGRERGVPGDLGKPKQVIIP
jgi:cytoskeleton protein RodZ